MFFPGLISILLYQSKPTKFPVGIIRGNHEEPHFTSNKCHVPKIRAHFNTWRNLPSNVANYPTEKEINHFESGLFRFRGLSNFSSQFPWYFPRGKKSCRQNQMKLNGSFLKSGFMSTIYVYCGSNSSEISSIHMCMCGSMDHWIWYLVKWARLLDTHQNTISIEVTGK